MDSDRLDYPWHVLASPEQPAAMTSWAAPDLQNKDLKSIRVELVSRPSFQVGAPPVFTGGSCVRPPIVEGYNRMRIFPGEIFGLVVPGSWVQ